jgi:hypothetical protein
MLKRILLLAANLTAARTSSTEVASNLQFGCFFAPLSPNFSTSGMACLHTDAAGHDESVASILQEAGPAGAACDTAKATNNERTKDFMMMKTNV